MGNFYYRAGRQLASLHTHGDVEVLFEALKQKEAALIRWTVFFVRDIIKKSAFLLPTDRLG